MRLVEETMVKPKLPKLLWRILHTSVKKEGSQVSRSNLRFSLNSVCPCLYCIKAKGIKIRFWCNPVSQKLIGRLAKLNYGKSAYQ